MKKTLLIVATAFCLNINAQIINTIVGNGISGFTGNGGAATNAELFNPIQVAKDISGNMYVVDYTDNRVRKITTAGIILPFAGNGTAGFTGDGAAATNAEFNGPSGVAVDALGNVYISDNFNDRIRKVNTNGIISTFAGNGGGGYTGNGAAATAAAIGTPYGLATDASGNLYFADVSNFLIRKISTGGIISAVAGNAQSGFSGDGGQATAAKLYAPFGVTVDALGNVYIADKFNNRIRKVIPSGIISTIAGNGTAGFAGDGGSATSAELYNPTDVAVDAAGNLYVADYNNQRVRKITSTGSISTVAGNGTAGFAGDGAVATAAELNAPTSVFIDASGSLFISDYTNARIRKVNTSGVISTFAGNGTGGYTGDGNPATIAALNNPTGLTVDAIGNVYVADYNNQRIRKIGTDGTIFSVAGNGTAGFTGDGGAATNAEINFPTGVSLDASGNIYFADNLNYRIRKVSSNGIVSTVVGNGTLYTGDGIAATAAGLNDPRGMAFDALGNMYIADRQNHRIRMVNTNGIISTFAGSGAQGYTGDGGQATAAKLGWPTGVKMDASGSLYISDDGSMTLRKVNSNGIISTVAGTGSFGYSGDGSTATSAALWGPSGVELDASGNVYVVDHTNYRIRVINTSGIISTVVGDGIGSFAGDGGMATAAELNYPYGMAFDVSGNMYITDQSNNRIRKVYYCSSGNPNPTVSYTLTADIAPHTWDAYPTYSSNVVSARWYWGDGKDTLALYPSHTYSVAGTYSICVAAYSACGDSAVSCQNDAVSRSGNNSPYSNMVYVNVLQSQTTSITKSASSIEVSIYPNPASSSLQVTFSGNIQNTTLQITDILGNTVKQENIKTEKTSIDVADLNEGVYTISISSNEGVVNKRVVIVR